MSGCEKFSSGDGKRIQIRAGEHGVQSVLVFLQTTIHGFPVAELTLDDPECVLYFAAHRGFAVFHAAFPVDGVVANLGRTAQCCFIWYGFCHKVDTREFPHGILL